jgi:PAS domain S-box-containing protein
MAGGSMHKILVVDDEVIIAAELEDRLAAMGYQVIGLATSGREAVDLAQSLQPDLIIMDIMMPGELDGIEAAAIIRNNWDIPTLFLSAFGDGELIERAKQAIPAGYILKPFQEIQIAAAIEIALHKNELEKQLKVSEARYRAVVEDQSELICRFAPNLQICFVNEAFCRFFADSPESFIGNSFMEGIERQYGKKLKEALESLSVAFPTGTVEHPVFLAGGPLRWLQWSIRAIYDSCGQLVEYQSVGRDVTERIRMEQALKKAKTELEHRVKVRTEELEVKSATLEELNTALKIILKKRDEDKLTLENEVLTNIRELVIPFLDKAKKNVMDERTSAYLNIMESTLSDITSPFARSISIKYSNLTPTEVKVAHLIKQGLATKEIAELLSVSTRTIESYRNNIRKKMGIKNKKVNLRTHLHPSKYS